MLHTGLSIVLSARVLHPSHRRVILETMLRAAPCRILGGWLDDGWLCGGRLGPHWDDQVDATAQGGGLRLGGLCWGVGVGGEGGRQGVEQSRSLSHPPRDG